MEKRDEIDIITPVKEILAGYQESALDALKKVPNVFVGAKVAAGCSYITTEFGERMMEVETSPPNYLRPQEENYVSFQSRILDYINNAGDVIGRRSVNQLLDDPEKMFSTLNNLLEDANSNVSNFVTDTKLGIAVESISEYIHDLIDGREDFLKEEVNEVTDWAKEVSSDISNFFKGELNGKNQEEVEYSDFVHGSNYMNGDGTMDLSSFEDDVEEGDSILNGNDNSVQPNSIEAGMNEVGSDMGWSDGKAEGDVEAELDTDIGADYEDVGMDIGIGVQEDVNDVISHEYDGMNELGGEFEQNLGSILSDFNSLNHDINNEGFELGEYQGLNDNQADFEPNNNNNNNNINIDNDNNYQEGNDFNQSHNNNNNNDNNDNDYNDYNNNDFGDQNIGADVNGANNYELQYNNNNIINNNADTIDNSNFGNYNNINNNNNINYNNSNEQNYNVTPATVYDNTPHLFLTAVTPTQPHYDFS
jgi:hypothetical protein